jgi:hypothetical protein
MTFTRRAAICSTVLAAIAAPLATETAAAERHPAIRNAIRALEKAKDDMQHADHDFGGHRAEALAECDRAINQLKLALQFANK